MLNSSNDNLCDEFKMYSQIPDETIALIQQKFTWVTDKTSYVGITSLQYKEVVRENTYTGILPGAQCKALFNDEVIMSERVFCMEGATSFVTGFKLPDPNITVTWLPSFCKLLFIAKNYKEYGLPYPELADGYETYVFSGDPAQIESAFSLSELRGGYDTYYRATVAGNQPVTIERYAVNQENSIFVFDLQYLKLAKRLKRTDLL